MAMEPEPREDFRVPPRGEEEFRPAPPRRAGAGEQAGVSLDEFSAMLGQRAEFNGKLSFAGKVRIDGKFEGEIVTGDLVIISSTARVSADITCGTLVSEGVINGSVRAATAVELRPPARLKGNVTTPSLLVEKGVVFDGSSKMENVEEQLQAAMPTAANTG